uniref:Uncharacterized protein n=1 Tax=Arundo donax TaxID=35708 RepID=A0A0A8YXJ1_ARUDO
MALDNAYFIR